MPSKVEVVFPGGQRVEATIIKVDLLWELASLRIEPEAAKGVVPYPIADAPPLVNDPLWFAGYGSGAYLSIKGAATGYVAAGDQRGRETLKMTGAARQGDSGGPIINEEGRLVGVLWGTDGESVMGTYCGRIHKFLGHGHQRGGSASGPGIPDNSSPLPTPDGAADDAAPPPVDLGSIQTQLDALAAAIAAIPAGATGEQGSLGEPGSPGEPGLPGVPGPAGDSATVDIDAIVGQVLSQLLGTDDKPGLLPGLLPPLPVRQIQMRRGPDGELESGDEQVDEVFFGRGEGLTIRLYPPE